MKSKTWAVIMLSALAVCMLAVIGHAFAEAEENITATVTALDAHFMLNGTVPEPFGPLIILQIFSPDGDLIYIEQLIVDSETGEFDNNFLLRSEHRHTGQYSYRVTAHDGSDYFQSHFEITDSTDILRSDHRKLLDAHSFLQDNHSALNATHSTLQENYDALLIERNEFLWAKNDAVLKFEMLQVAFDQFKEDKHEELRILQRDIVTLSAYIDELTGRTP